MPVTMRPIRMSDEDDVEWAGRLDAYTCALEEENDELLRTLRSAEAFEKSVTRLYNRCVRNTGFILDWADCVFDNEILETVDEMATAEGRSTLKADEAAVLGARAMRRLLREYLDEDRWKSMPLRRPALEEEEIE